MISVCKNITYIFMYQSDISLQNKLCVKMKKSAFYKYHIFKTKLYSILKEKDAICQMVPFVTKYCIVVIILVNAKGIICHVTPFNSK